MTDLYLLRHAESYGNLYARLYGLWDLGLTKRGEHQASLVAERFVTVPLDAVYSSPLKRAYETARFIADAKGMAVTPVEDLHEQNMGYFESLSWHEAKDLYPEGHRQWVEDPAHPCPGGESEPEAALRLRAALERLASLHPDGSFAAVTHAVAFNNFIDLTFPGKRVFGPNTAVSHLRRDSKRDIWEAVFLQDGSHLPAESQARKKRWFTGWLPGDFSLLYRVEETGEDRETVAGYSRGERVGSVTFSLDADDCTIERLEIGPKYRRCGYASQLIGEVLCRAHRHGAQYIRTTAQGGSEWSSCLDRHGFVTEGTAAVMKIQLPGRTSAAV